MRPPWRACLIGLGLALVLAAAPARAQNFELLQQSLDGSRQGYSVLRVWGTHYEMGYALGAALAEDVIAAVAGARSAAENHPSLDYDTLLASLEAASWPMPGADQELEGIVDGVRSVVPASTVDVMGLKILNSYGDWAYACRAHQCWGRYVAAPIKTLATRRLDFGTPFPSALHHVLCAWDPSDGGERWVTLAFPGMTEAPTALNAHGTLVSLHDFQSAAASGSGLVPRAAAARHLLTGVSGDDLEAHLAWAAQQLAGMRVATQTFINYHAPEGHGGVFTCGAGVSCNSAPRRPQSGFLHGEAMLTTNQQTDGLSAPSDDSFMEDYYLAGGVKTLDSHFELMGTGGLHLMSVAYRGKQDMTIWVLGRGRSDPLRLEWAELFATAAADGGVRDGAGPGGTERSCACGAGSAGGASGWPVAALLVALGGWRRRHSKPGTV